MFLTALSQVLICSLVLVTQPGLSLATLCSAEFECGDAADNLIDVVHDASTEELCQKMCSLNANCNYYTWFEEDSLCFLLSDCQDQDKPCDACHTGPPECPSTVPPSTTNHPENCASPSDPPNGRFDCDASRKECHLLCDPGYVTSGKSSVSCSRYSQWSQDPRQMSCEKAVLLVTGGDGGLQFVELYASTNSCITTMPSLPDLRGMHSLDYVDGEVLLCGGYSSRLSCLTLQPNNTWTKHSDLTRNRSSHSSAVFNSDLYLIGGGQANTTEVLRHKNNNDNQWELTWDVAEGTDGCSVNTDPGTAIVTGGHGCTKCVYQFNLQTGEKTKLQNMNEGRTSHGCALYQFDGDDFILAAGGWDGHNLRSSEVFSLKTGKWRIVGDLKEGKRGLQLAVVEGGKVVATGGRVGSWVDSVEMFDVEMEQWSQGLPLTHRRAYHGVTAVPGSRFGCTGSA